MGGLRDLGAVGDDDDRGAVGVELAEQVEDVGTGDRVLLAAVRIVASGEAVTAPSVTQRLIDHFVSNTPARRTDPNGWPP